MDNPILNTMEAAWIAQSTPELLTEILADTSSPDSTEMQQILNILPEDHYTEPIIEYEPLIQFRTIREELLEISYLQEDQRIYIFSYHPTVYKLPFILRNPIPLRLPPHPPIENKLAVVIIPRVSESQQPTPSLMVMENSPQHLTPMIILPDPMDSSVQTLTSHWDNTLILVEQPSPTPPMILLLWNCRGIHNHNFKAHFRELVNYHKPSLVVLTETKAVGAKADAIMANFNSPNSAKVDFVGLSRGIYIL